MSHELRIQTDSIIVVGCQHILQTTGSLIESLAHLGIHNHSIFILGKCYSSNQDVRTRLSSSGIEISPGSHPAIPGYHDQAISNDAEQLWSRVTAHAAKTKATGIIIIDDGSHCIKSIPKSLFSSINVVAIEQTTSGLRALEGAGFPFPVISVAGSAAKIKIEPYFIAETVLEKAASWLKSELAQFRFGVVGMGNIGSSLARNLASRGEKVLVFDSERSGKLKGVHMLESQSALELVEQSDIVFGCTGQDFSRKNDLANLPGQRHFFSCSSGDIEFKSILQSPGLYELEAGPCPTFAIDSSNGMGRIVIPRSGFPINFDNSPTSVKDSDIQLTRGLMLGAFIQALNLIARPQSQAGSFIMLAPRIQKICVESWQKHTTAKDFPTEVGYDWYKRNSWGVEDNS